MLARASIVLLVAVMAAATIARASQTESPREHTPLAMLPLDLGKWQGREAAPFDKKTLAILGADEYVTRTYRSAGVPVGVYIGYWASQRQGATMHSPLNCLPGAGWAPISKRALAVRVPDGQGERAMTINRYLVERAGDRQLVLYWYQGRGRVVASEYLNRMFQVTDALRFHRSDGALVRLMIPTAQNDPSAIAAERDGLRFIAAFFPQLERFLPS